MKILDRMNKLQRMLSLLFIVGNASRNVNEDIGAYAYFSEVKRMPLRVKEVVACNI